MGLLAQYTFMTGIHSFSQYLLLSVSVNVLSARDTVVNKININSNLVILTLII